VVGGTCGSCRRGWRADDCYGSRFVSGSDVASWTMVQKVEDGGVAVSARVANDDAAIAPAIMAASV